MAGRLSFGQVKMDTQKSVAMLLEKGADVNATNNIGWTALIWASVNGHKETVAKLLKDGADINAKTNLGKTAIMMARWEGRRTEIINMLTAAIETEKKVRDSKQKTMEQVVNRDVKTDLPCLHLQNNKCQLAIEQLYLIIY